MTETPAGFSDIDPDVLRRQAVEDWAVEVKPSDSLKKVIKAYEDAGVFWEDYAEKYGYAVASTLDEPDSVDVLEDPAPAPAPEATAQIVQEHTVASRTPEPTRAELPVQEFVTRTTPQAPVVAQPLQVPNDAPPYLIKMERPNVRYQVGKYTFTKQHPYAIVDAKDAEFVLTHEPGFRQALPSELAEFYGQ